MATKEDLMTFPLAIVEDSGNSLEIRDDTGFVVCQIYREEDLTSKDWELANWIVDALYEKGKD